jgi:hypothetical protein
LHGEDNYVINVNSRMTKPAAKLGKSIILLGIVASVRILSAALPKRRNLRDNLQSPGQDCCAKAIACYIDSKERLAFCSGLPYCAMHHRDPKRLS